MTESRGRILGVVFAIVFVDLLGFGILIPVIPLYAESFGASEFVVGVLLASYSAMQFVAAPFLGSLSDRRGRRPVLLLSILGSVLAWTLFGLAWSLAVLFVARLVAGALAGNIAAAQAAIADVTPPEERAKGLGLVGAAFGLGFVFGPALGGLLSSPGVLAAARSVLPAVVPVTKFSLPSFAAAAICLFDLVLAAAVLPETNTKNREVDRTSRTDRLKRALSNPALAALVVAFFVASFAFSGMESMFVLFLDQIYGYGTTTGGYVLAYVGVVIAILQGGLVGRLTKRYGERALAIGGAALLAVSLVSLPFTPTIGDLLPAVVPDHPLVALLLVLTVLAAGNGLLNVSLSALVSRAATDDEQGGAFGLTQSAGSLARTVGPPVAGALYTVVGYWTPFVAGGVLVVPVAFVLLTNRQLAQREVGV